MSLDTQFNPRLAVANAAAILTERRRLSLAAAEQLTVLRKNYGAGAREHFIATHPSLEYGEMSPAVIFLHGGYWRSGEAEDNLVLAPAIAGMGARPIFLGYPLCPTATLSEVVAAVRRGIDAIISQAVVLGFDPGRVVLAGTSAGAHLAACALKDETIASRVSGALLLTGIYDLTPVPLIQVNDEIGVTEADVRDHSPLFARYPRVRSVFAVGGLETAMWRAQSFAMAALAESGGAPTTLIDVPGRHHFDLVMELLSATSELRRALCELLETSFPIAPNR